MGKKHATEIWETSGVLNFTLHAAAEPRRYAVPFNVPLADREDGSHWSIVMAHDTGRVALELDGDVEPKRRERVMALSSLAYAFDLEPYRKSGSPLRTQPKRWAKKGGVEAVVAAPTTRAERLPSPAAVGSYLLAHGWSVVSVAHDWRVYMEVVLPGVGWKNAAIIEVPQLEKADGYDRAIGMTLADLARKEGRPVADVLRDIRAHQDARPGKGERPQPSGAEHAAPAVEAESTPPVLADHGPGSAVCCVAPATTRGISDERLLEVVRVVVRENARVIAETLAPLVRRLDAALGTRAI